MTKNDPQHSNDTKPGSMRGQDRAAARQAKAQAKTDARLARVLNRSADAMNDQADANESSKRARGKR